MLATPDYCSVSTPRALYLAFELGWSEWKLACGTSLADSPRQRTLRARNLEGLHQEIAKAKKRFGLAENAPVRSCYEAGRDGFWLHRYLLAHGVDNQVIDSSSIEVKRRRRRAKNDRLDAIKLWSMLLRYHGGEKDVWSVLRVPSREDEDRRQLHRDLMELKAERTHRRVVHAGGAGGIPQIVADQVIAFA